MKFIGAAWRTARIGIVVGAAAIAILTAIALWWALKPREQLLFGNLRETDAAEIVAALEEWKVPHSVVDGGSAISVPEDMVYPLRMRLVSAGIPKGGHVGFELFDDSDFGVTEFAQRVNYQRALQGEIERTIAALPGVETARVHLTIRRPGLFVGEEEASKASVAVSTRAEHTLTKQQVRGIRSLVSAAVEGLSMDRVTVLDSSGALLAGGESAGPQRGIVARDDEESEIEARIQRRLYDLIGHALGDSEYSVSVDVALNFDTIRKVNERPLGRDSGAAIVARKRVNTAGSSEEYGSGPSNEEIEYAHGTTREEIVHAPGSIQRISVAAILPSDVSDQDIDRIQALIAAAAGIDESRGDRIEVSRIGRIGDPREIERDRNAIVPDLSARARDSEASGDDGRWEDWQKAAMLLTLGLAIGGLGALLTQRKSAKWSAGERDAALEKMRAWLADGSLSP